MYNIDIIISSNAATKELETITKNAIKSIFKSNTSYLKEGTDVNPVITVIEQNKDVKYDCNTVYVDTFDYYGNINKVLKNTTNDYILVIHNDVVFREYCLTNALNVMWMNQLYSVCPIDPLKQGRNPTIFKKELEEGYLENRQYNPWGVFFKRSLLKEIEFNQDYIKQLQEKNIKHAIVPSAHIYHLGAKTLNTLKSKDNKENIVNITL